MSLGIPERRFVTCWRLRIRMSEFCCTVLAPEYAPRWSATYSNDREAHESRDHRDDLPGARGADHRVPGWNSAGVGPIALRRSRADVFRMRGLHRAAAHDNPIAGQAQRGVDLGRGAKRPAGDVPNLEGKRGRTRPVKETEMATNQKEATRARPAAEWA